MKIQSEAEMDRVFSAFHDDRRSPSPRPLASWISEYPDLRTAFVQWAADLPAFEIAESRPAYPELEARTLAIGKSILERMGLDGGDTGALASINQAARAVELSPRQLAERLGVGITLIAKLNRRLIRSASVPARFIERLCEELRVSAEVMRAYLAQEPTLAQGAAYKADHAPEAAEAEEFADAVHNAPDMTEEQKRQWLS